MDLLASVPLLVALPLLALLDSLSAGTLLIPLFLLLAPGRPKTGRILLYLATITAFYAAVGVLLSLGLVQFLTVSDGFLASTPGLVLRLIAGIVLLVVAFAMPGGRKKGTAGDPAADAVPAGSRLARWRSRLLDGKVGVAVVMSVALAAGLVELTTMVPYIAAMTMLADAGLGFAPRTLAILGYCLVMILPALVLLAVRVLARDRVENALQKLTNTVYRWSSGETMAWIIGIIGFLLARSAATELGLFDAIGQVMGR